LTHIFPSTCMPCNLLSRNLGIRDISYKRALLFRTLLQTLAYKKFAMHGPSSFQHLTDDFLQFITLKLAFHNVDTDTNTGSSRGCRRVGRVGEDPREKFGVGVVECGLNSAMGVKQPWHVHRRQVLSTTDRRPSLVHCIWCPASFLFHAINMKQRVGWVSRRLHSFLC